MSNGKKFEGVFGDSEAMSDAKKMLVIFVMIASLASVATLASVQIASAASGGGEVANQFCQTVRITNPKAGSSLIGVVTMTGSASYGLGTCTNKVLGSQLTWYVDGKYLGTGSSKSFAFGCDYNHLGDSTIMLKAKIPSPTLHTISKTITVHNGCIT